MTRAWVALVLEAVFLLLAFGIRSWIQWRRTGSSGFIRPRRGAPPVELLATVLFTVGLVLIVAAPIADLAGFARLALFEGPGAAAAGAALAVAGIVVTFIAQVNMGDSWRIGVDPDEQTQLVTGGVFGLVRNPIFSAMILATVGLVLLVPNALSLAALVSLVVGLELQVRVVEEPYLRTVHGDSYRRYLGAAGRFVPGVGIERS